MTKKAEKKVAVAIIAACATTTIAKILEIEQRIRFRRLCK